jgi:hypothetical protein
MKDVKCIRKRRIHICVTVKPSVFNWALHKGFVVDTLPSLIIVSPIINTFLSLSLKFETHLISHHVIATSAPVEISRSHG